MGKPQTTLLLLLISGALFLASRAMRPSLRPTSLPEPARKRAAAPTHSPDQHSVARSTWVIEVDGWSIGFDQAAPALIPAMRSRMDNTIIEPKPPSEFRSPYDHLIAYHAEQAGFDWRLVSALIAVESGFDPAVESEAGAFGLMQVRKEAAEEVGEADFFNPDSNIRTGVRYLKWLEQRFPDAKGRDRLALTLAAYNVGPAHVEDARLLARRFGYDANRWYGSLEHMLPLLEQPAVYEQLANGFARGRDVVEYVERILERFDQHRLATTN